MAQGDYTTVGGHAIIVATDSVRAGGSGFTITDDHVSGPTECICCGVTIGSPCCLGNQLVGEELTLNALCVHYTTSGNALINATGEHQFNTFWQGLDSEYRTSVCVSGNYVDPTSGYTVCWYICFCLIVQCGGFQRVIWGIERPTVSYLNYAPSQEDPNCRLLILDTPSACTRGLYFDPLTGLGIPIVPDLVGDFDTGDTCNLGNIPDFTLTLPGHADLGIPAQTFTVHLSLSQNDIDNQCSFIDTSSPLCCQLFDGGDTIIPGGGDTDTTITGPCCPGTNLPRILGIAIANVSCAGCMDGLLGALTYVPALRAWTGSFIACGTFITVYFYCVPGFNTFGIEFYCAGILATPDNFVISTCDPLDAQATLRYPVVGFQPPCCPNAAGTMICRIFKL